MNALATAVVNNASRIDQAVAGGHARADMASAHAEVDNTTGLSQDVEQGSAAASVANTTHIRQRVRGGYRRQFLPMPRYCRPQFLAECHSAKPWES